MYINLGTDSYFPNFLIFFYEYICAVVSINPSTNGKCIVVSENKAINVASKLL